ncbi:MAG: 3'-5' exonuclease domain-containing protein 2, partial [Bacteroidales bacterium]|nr:3'-5' exonuclease domain-containing protein 2 [Candidatus Cryptobacteroides aphodequi]
MGFKLSVLPEEIEKLPLGAFPGTIHVIDKPGLAYNSAIAYLRKQKVLGFDTETRPVFSPGQKHHDVALVQLSGPDQAFLFRINKLGLRKRLRAVLADPDILKIGAACHDDVRGLQKLHGFEEKNYVDLQREVWQWGIKDKSVKKMAAN